MFVEEKEDAMGTSRRRFLQGMVALAGVAAAGGLAGCGGTKKLGAASLRLNWTVTGVHAPYYLGMSKGYFSAEGIELEIRPGSGSGTTAQLVSNKSDTFGLVDAAAAIPLMAQGLPIKCVAMISPASSLAVIARKDSGIKTLKDLEGKTLAVTPGDSLTQIWPAVVAKNNLDASKIKLVNVDAAAKIPSVLEKRADALLGSSADQNFTLQAQGVETVDLNFASFGVNLLNLGVFAHPDTIAKQGDVIKAFLRAMAKSLAAWEKEFDAAIDELAKAAPEMDRKILIQQATAYKPQLKSPNCPTGKALNNCPADWQQTYDLMVQYRDLKTTMKSTDFYTNEFIP
jgi:NitT/TauT family transport system substrate-binding protein